MKWRETDLETIGDIGRMVSSFTDRTEANAFMAAYRQETEHADVNIGYLSGYYDHETMHRIQDLCGVVHPIFGKAQPTARQAFAAGQAVAAMGGGAEAQATVRALLDPEEATE